MKISVILRARKVDPLQLSMSIKSILNQTYTNIELLVIYQKSSDKIDVDMEHVFEENLDDHRLTVIEQKNKGLSNAVNLGLQSSTGDFIAIMDSDDISEENRFCEQLEYINETKSDLVGSWFTSISEAGQEIGKVQLPVTPHEIRKKIMLRNPICHPSIFFRKSLIDKVGYYNPAFDGAEDYDLYFRVLAANLKISNVPKFLIRVREVKSSVMRGSRWRKARLANIAVKKNAIKNLGFNSPRDLLYYYFISLLFLLIPPRIAVLLRRLPKQRYKGI